MVGTGTISIRTRTTCEVALLILEDVSVTYVMRSRCTNALKDFVRTITGDMLGKSWMTFFMGMGKTEGRGGDTTTITTIITTGGAVDGKA